jgi:hypothetical protein
MNFKDYKKQRSELSDLRIDQICIRYKQEAASVDAFLDDILYEFDIHNPDLIGKLRNLVTKSWDAGNGFAKECGAETLSCIRDCVDFMLKEKGY